jgi:catechol 2,3-dioxygenase-like lactoylglutathione lyase family enzyme
MIDHVYISVGDVARARSFYAAALSPIGWTEFFQYDSKTGPTGVPDLFGLIDRARDSAHVISTTIWLRQRQPGETGLYIGFVADSPTEVDAAYAAALGAGGTDDGGAGPRPYFGDGYYAANVMDFDGNRLEFVNKSWNPKRPA